MLRLLRRKAQKLRKETGDDRWQAPIEKLNRSVARTVLRSTYRPILLLVLEPMCLNLCIFSGILLGILYLFFGAFQLVFGNVYGFELWQRGLCFLGLFVGMVFAIMTDPFWRRVYARLEKHHETVEGKADDPQPEWRLPPGMVLFLLQCSTVAVSKANIGQRLLAVLWSPSASLSLPGRFIPMSIGSFPLLAAPFLGQGKYPF